jgi:predicted transcriptional regulator
MNFRSLLLKIDESFQDGRFTAQSLALRLDRPKKEVSNSLRRLHKMGFLRRESVKRHCLTSKGTVCFKGFQYKYELSKQGASYVRWLRERKSVEDTMHLILMSKVYSHLPEDLSRSIALVGAMRSAYKYKGPVRNFRFLDNDASPLVHLSVRNAELKQENSVLKWYVTDSSFLLEYFTGLASKYKEENQQLIDEMNKLTVETCRLYAENTGFMLNWYLKDFMSMLEVINTMRSTNELLILLLANALPRETFVRTMNFVSEFRGKMWQKYIQEPSQRESSLA